MTGHADMLLCWLIVLVYLPETPFATSGGSYLDGGMYYRYLPTYLPTVSKYIIYRTVVLVTGLVQKVAL